MSIFGTQLHKIRLERGLSLTDLASKIGFRRLTIYKWETGKANPKSFDTVLAVAKFFQVSPDYFFNPESLMVTQSDIFKLRDEISHLREEVHSLRHFIHKPD